MPSKRAEAAPPQKSYYDAHSPLGRSFVDLVDEVMRLNGRLIAATKMTTKVAGLRPPHWIILSAVACANEPPTVPRIGRALGLSRQAVQRTADHLAELGYVAWIPNPDHLRANRLVPTEKGLETYRLANDESATWANRIVAGMDQDKLEAAVALLHDVRERLEADARRR